MGSKKYIIGVILAAIVVGVAGYLIGSKSKSPTSGQETETSAPGQTDASSLVAELEAGLRKNPDDLSALRRLADGYFDIAEFDKAAGHYKRLALKSNDVDLYNEIGISLHYAGRSSEGIKYIDEGIRKNPGHQRIWLTKGFIMAHGIGDLKAARAAWEKARSLNPDSPIGKAAGDYLAEMNKQAVR
ncbi:MAG: hypothetical protein HY887_02235 [Deltaproteobacteria bacterium]|nr:hypothetical protein [Deltaproteobacteria bacterium]